MPDMNTDINIETNTVDEIIEGEYTENDITENDITDTEIPPAENEDSRSKNTPKEPLAKGIISLCLGILSILCSLSFSLIGIIFGSVAQKLGGAVIADFERTVSGGLARAGKITGAFGVIFSIVSLLLGMLLTVLIIFGAVALIKYLVSLG